MADTDYKDVFVSEARELLDSLNNSLLNLEKDMQNKDYINQIFRVCHTIKGSSAMMGYNTFSELSNNMENLLGKIRDKNIKVTTDMIDTLFEAVDILEEGLENITHKNIDAIDISSVSEKLRKYSDEGTAQAEPEFNPAEFFKPDENEQKAISEARTRNNNVFRVIVLFNTNSLLKGAKAQILLRKSKSIIDNIIFSNPSIEDIKDGKISGGFELVVETSHHKSDFLKTFDSVSESTVFILNLDEIFSGSIKDKEEDKKRDPTKYLGKLIQNIKVDVKKLDALVNLVGELLISNMRLKQIAKKISDASLNEVISSIELLTKGIQDQVMQERMVPVGQILNRFPRLVRDLAAKEKKKVNLIISGEDIELDRTVLDEIGEPLIHALRNSVDHGIEMPEERKGVGKPEEGTIKLTASREKNVAIIKVTDDGKGIDVEKVGEKAISQGLISLKDLSNMNQQQKLNLVFKPGLSTKDNVTDISGRGVGMDVVLSKIKKIGGTVKLTSSMGKGTKLELRLPLTLAIITSLIIETSGEKYAIPLSNVISTIEVEKDKIKTIQGNELIILRGEDVPIIRIHDYLRLPRTDKEVYDIVITERGERKVGFIVDGVISQQPILIKNLHSLVRGIRGIAGASILGDGKVCLILDIDNIN